MRSYRLEFTTRELSMLRQTIHDWWTQTPIPPSEDQVPLQVAFASSLLADVDSVLAFDDRHIHADYRELPARARVQCRTLGCTTSSVYNGFCERHGGEDG